MQAKITNLFDDYKFKKNRFKKNIQSLKQDIFRMGALVEESCTLTHRALFYREIAVSYQIPFLDKKIDLLYRKIEFNCLSLITLESPNAQNSRFIGAYMQIVRDLERIGDYAQEIAEIARLLASLYSPDELLCMLEIKQMFHQTQLMLAKSLEALANLDAEVGLQVKQLDSIVDDLDREIYSTLASQRNVQGKVEPLLLLGLVIRNIERMADHATNIGKRVGYIVNGYRHCKGKINDLKQDTFRMAALVKNSFHLSHEALFYQNLASAEKITPIERKIDEFYRQIQSDCVFLMTLQAPDGKDSRLIGAYMQLVRDLERIGDYAQDLSEIAYKLSRYAAHPSMSCMSQIEEMFNHTQIMLAKSLVALADLDAEVGQRVKQLDLNVNRLYQQVYTTLASQQDVKGVIEPLLLLAFVIRHIERMADHATNIGQRVAFIVVSDS